MNDNFSINKLTLLYGNENLDYQKKRYDELNKSFIKKFNEQPEYFFSSPGRTEIAGNHTDHNNGKVLAAAINLDSIAAVKENNSHVVKIFSENLNQLFVVDLKNLSKRKNEIGKTVALIRGIAKLFIDSKLKIGGFNAFIKSDVLIGSGLSSSASFEVLISKIFSTLFNKNKISPIKLATISKYVENEYFGKPCGLMDQLTCAVGGAILIDFKNSLRPSNKKIDFNLEKFGYKLLIVDTGGSHSDLTEDYSSITDEMKKVSEYFNEKCLRKVGEKLIGHINNLRSQVGDRPILRSLHFIFENKRVEKIKRAIQLNDINEAIRLINKSGDSSFKYLQNIYSTKNIQEQNISLALALTEIFFEKNKINAASRVHGGGFSGTIQVFLPSMFVKKYIKFIEKYFSKNSVKEINIRNYGAVCLSEL